MPAAPILRKNLKFLTLLLAALVPALPGAAYTKSQIDGSIIQNRSVGFYGLTLRIPDKWAVFTPVPDIKFRSNNNAQRAWRMATSFDGRPGNTTHEIITLHDGTNGIALAITTGVGVSWPSEKTQKKDYLSALKGKAQGFAFSAGDIFVREVAVVDQRYFAKVGRTLPIGEESVVNLVYIVGLAPSYEISLTGVANDKNRAALESAMNEIMKSMVTEKSKRPRAEPKASGRE